MNKNLKNAFSVIVTITGLSYMLHDYYLTEKEPIDYPFLKTLKKEVKGILLEKEFSKIYKNTYRMNLSSNQRFTLGNASIIEIGDSIYKPANKDSLYIYRNDTLFLSYRLFNKK